jgi:pilus assembly protein CpaE
VTDLRESEHGRTSPRKTGQVVSVLSAKGGCGKTTVATNLAVVLHAGGARRVCLLDLDLAFGDVASSLKLEPVRTLADAGSSDCTLDAAAVSRLTVQFRPGLDCILAPVGPGEAEQVAAELIVELLAVLPSIYDYIVVDTPAQIAGVVLAALDCSDHLVLVTTPVLRDLKNVRQTLDTLDLLAYDRNARSIVVNRSDASIDLGTKDIENVLKAPISGRIPPSFDVPASINDGVPLVSAQPDHPFSSAVREFAEARILSVESRAAQGEYRARSGPRGTPP